MGLIILCFILPFSESTAVYIPEGTIKYDYTVDLE